MKLSRKLKMTFVLMALVPLAVVSTGVYIEGRSIIHERTIHHLASKNHLKKNELVRLFEGKKLSLRELARRPLVRQYSEVMALTESTADPEWQKTHEMIDKDHLNITLKEEGNFLDLFILRAEDGMVMTSTDESIEGMYRERERFFKKGKQHTFVQNAYYSLTREETVITIGTPIRDTAGDAIAVLAGHVDLTELSKIMMVSDRPDTTEESYLVNKFNFLITATRNPPERTPGTVVHSKGVERALEGEKGVDLYANYAGVQIIGVYEWLSEFEMAILSEVSVKEAFAPVKTFGNAILILSAMAICFAIVVGFILAKAISGPVGKLMSGTARIGRDGLDIRIDVDTKDEFGALADSFNEMTGKLREKETVLRGTLTSLEGKVAERTRDLSEKNLILEREIEDRTKVEQALIASEHNLLNAQRMAMLGSWERDIVTGALKMSPVIMDIYGFDHGQTISFEDLIPLIHLEDKERFLEGTLVAAQSGENFNIDYRIIRGDGETRHVHSEIEYSKNSKGDVVKAFGITQDVSDLMRRELELKEQEERLRKITEGSLEGIVISEDGVIVEANPQIAEILGYTLEELVGKSIPDEIVVPDDREMVKMKMVEGHGETYQHDVVKKNGEVITVEVRGRNTLFRGRNVRLASVRNITDRIKAEKALKLSEFRHRELFENISSGIAVYEAVNDGEGFLFSEINRTCERIEGVQREDVIGKNLLEVFPGVVEFGLLDVLQRVHRTGVSEHLPLGIYKDERITGWRDNFLYKLPTGEVVAAYSDETDRMNALKDLGTSEVKYRTLFESARDAIFLLKKKEDGSPGRFVDVNKVACDRLGYTKEEFLGMTPMEILSDDALSKILPTIEKLQSDGKMTFETVQVAKDGRIIEVENSTHSLVLGGLDYFQTISRDITERKAKEGQLKALQNQLEHVITRTPAVIYTAEAHGDFSGTFVSDNIVEVLGHEPRHFLDDPAFWVSHIHPEDRENVLGGLSTLLENGNHYHEYRFRCKDGSYRWMGDGLTLVLDEEGEPEEIVGYWIDVTERVQAQKALDKRYETERVLLDISTELLGLTTKDTDQYLSQVLRTIGNFLHTDSCSIFMFSEETNIFSMTHEWVKYGTESMMEAFSNKDISEYPWMLGEIQKKGIIHIPDVAQLPAEAHDVREVLESIQLKSTISVPMVSKDFTIGTLALAQFRDQRAWEDEEINLLKIISQNLANTLRRVRLEDQLHTTATELEFFHMLDSAILNQIGIMEIGKLCVDKLSDICSAQRIYIKTLNSGGTLATVLAVDPGAQNTEPGDTHILDRSNPLYAEMCEAFQESDTYIIDELSKAPCLPDPILALEAEGFRTGVILPIKVEGKVAGFMECWWMQPHSFTVAEMGLFKEAVNSLSISIYQAELAEKVRKNTAELELLVDTRTEELQRANEELESFAYSVTHDLKAPLRALQGFSQALLEDYGEKMDSTAREYAVYIRDSARRMDELIQDLLTYSRLGQFDLLIRAVDIQDMVKEAVNLSAKSILESKAAVQFDVASINVKVHKSSMIMVLENLLSNAMKFVEDGKAPEIHIWSEMEDDGFLRLWVEDNGIGVDPDYHDRIFRVFERLHGIETYPGTGIGLSIAKRVLDRLGGSIGIESQEGQGSRFRIEVPLA